VMELVRGVSITEYCDTNKLDTRERLELFVPVCNAVHHAHQKGIIHRDIKPSNIMVTLHDGQPVPKVIDFGIAKATNQRLTERTIFTRYAELIGTPEYMSPEQAEMSGLDIDTRTDIYSLGVVLYELLTGALPFDSDTLRAAALGEIQRIIREEEPPRPSTRLSMLGEGATKIAASRRTDLGALTKRLHTELEWIPLMAMRKDRTRRYRSASEFADDVQNYLGGRPLIAGPESAAYRFSKFVHRYRAPVAMTAAVTAALVIGLVVSTSLYVRVKRAQDKVVKLESKAETDRKLAAAQRLHAEGRYDAAVVEVEGLLTQADSDPKLRLLYAQLLFDTGRTQEAQRELQPLTEREPEVAGAAHYLLAHLSLGSDPAGAAEHQRLAESLSPQTPDAYVLRAITTSSSSKKIEWLSKALELDPSHYAARKTRAIAYYATKDYANMRQDAEALTVMRPKDSLGYALRAIAEREQGKLAEALDDHNRAIQLCNVDAELPELHNQRRETYWRMENYQAALLDARRCTLLKPEDRLYAAHLFRVLMRLGKVEEAQEEFERADRVGAGAPWLLYGWPAKYIFDTLSASLPLSTLPQKLGADN